jgi:hypothetical protein
MLIAAYGLIERYWLLLTSYPSRAFGDVRLERAADRAVLTVSPIALDTQTPTVAGTERKQTTISRESTCVTSVNNGTIQLAVRKLGTFGEIISEVKDEEISAIYGILEAGANLKGKLLPVLSR